MKKIPVGILGATGMVGQHYVQMLLHHPWFEITFLAGSKDSAGKTYQEAVASKWHLNAPIPTHLPSLSSVDDVEYAKKRCVLIFSALPNENARAYDKNYVLQGLPLISNASVHRFESDVPLLIPECNSAHLEILRGKSSFIVAKPNCSIQSFVLPLTPLHEKFKVKKIHITTLQAVSGAGFPGVSSLSITDNVIPYIAHEEEKTECEPLKIWGEVKDQKIAPSNTMSISTTCTRVPVLDGHMAIVSCEFEKKPTLDEVKTAWHEFKGETLPSSPQKLIHYREEADRPQPRLDRHAGAGMSVTVGRLRTCPLFHIRFVALSHNLIRGAAGGGILNAELLVRKGLIK